MSLALDSSAASSGLSRTEFLRMTTPPSVTLLGFLTVAAYHDNFKSLPVNVESGEHPHQRGRLVRHKLLADSAV